MTRPSWDKLWMNVADVAGARSLCVRAQVGCVLVSPDNHVVAVSYNGPPAAFKHDDLPCTAWCPRARAVQCGESLDPEYGDCLTVHAEANALARADSAQLRGGTAYVSSAACFNCAKALANSGVTRVVHRVEAAHAHREPEKTEHLLRSCGLTVERWTA